MSNPIPMEFPLDINGTLAECVSNEREPSYTMTVSVRTTKHVSCLKKALRVYLVHGCEIVSTRPAETQAIDWGVLY